MQTHYNYKFDSGNNAFSFTTKNNIPYKVSFIVDETFSVLSGNEMPNIYQVVIEKVSTDLEPFDNKVSKTIEDIIRHFFSKIENCILYVCSNVGNKERKRHEIFNRWYKSSEYNKVIKKVNNKITFEDEIYGKTEIFTSLMYHINNPNYKEINKIYNKIEESLNEEK